MGESSAPGAVVVTPPQKVADLAERQRLGPLETARKGGSPLFTLVVGMLVAAGLFGVAALINWLVQYVRVEAVAFVAVLCVLAAVAVTVLTFYLVFRGSTSIYVYPGGIVWVGYGRPAAAGWTDVDTLYVSRRGDKETSADLVLFDGRSLTVEGHGKNGPDPLFDHLRRRMAGRGRPVLGGTFASAREKAGKETGFGDQTLARISAIVGVIGSLVLGFVLWKVGLPGPVAAILAPMIFAFLVIPVGLVVDTRLVRVGYAFLVVTGLVVLSVAIKIFDRFNWALVSVAVLAGEGAILAVWHAVYLRLPARRSTGRRKRLAATMHWQYQPRATVPVGGPQTARRLLGVPNDVTATTGEDAVHGTANGSAVMVVDRWRRPPRIPDPVQTVWVAQLPMALPYFAPSYFGDLAAAQREPGRLADHTTDAEVARLIAESPVRSAMTALRLPRSWWVEGGYLYATSPGGTTAEAERGVAENLTALAAAFPWQALRVRAG